MTTIKERVMQLLECKKIPKESFFAKVDTVSSNFRGAAAKTPLNSTTVSKILTAIPDVNPYWLISGIGEMFIKQTPENMNSLADADVRKTYVADMHGVISDITGTYSADELPEKYHLAAHAKYWGTDGNLWTLIKCQQQQLESQQRQLEIQAKMLATFIQEETQNK